jgi:peptide-methionine (S)-S-oxide reductase
MEQAIFAAGCFWGVEAAFRRVPGVTATAVGYIGGATPNPTYQAVCTGMTGHAEAVRVDFDPTVVTYEALLDLFWECHDPTQLNRQGPDVGTQYRTGIFFIGSEQESAACASKEALQASGRYPGEIVTEITAASEFCMAEDYHQQYFEKQMQGRRRWF